MKLGEIIKQRREQAGLSLQDLADAAGISKGYAWEVENGSTINVGLLTAIRIGIALSIPINVLAAAALQSQQEQQA